MMRYCNREVFLRFQQFASREQDITRFARELYPFTEFREPLSLWVAWVCLRIRYTTAGIRLGNLWLWDMDTTAGEQSTSR